MKTITLLPIARITLLASTLRVRIQMSEETIMRYAECMESTDDLNGFPPLEVYFDGKQYLLADGYLRLEAAKRAGHESIRVAINAGTADDAFWAAIIANGKHGLGLSRIERNRIIEIVVKRWPDRSSRMIAMAIGVSGKYVSRIRNELARRNEVAVPEKLQGLDGKMHPSKRVQGNARAYGEMPFSSVDGIPGSRTKKTPRTSMKASAVDVKVLIDLLFESCSDEVEDCFLGFFDEIVRRQGKEAGKKLLKRIFNRIVGLSD